MSKPKYDFDEVYAEAERIGREASKDIADKGAVGYANWGVKGNSAFGKWLVRWGYGRQWASGGVWVGANYPGQAFNGNRVAAEASCNYLQSIGIDAKWRCMYD